jgi:2-phosphosulfolactate phosphatase
MMATMISSSGGATTEVTIGDLERGTHGGAVVVIDVMRAFTTAAEALSLGAREVHCVESIERALELGAAMDGALVMGEERGIPPDGFDLGNSPVQFDGVDLRDRVIVHRTTNGTRGLAWVDAPLVLAAAATNAAATARAASATSPVHLVCTGWTSEDRACADHIASLLAGLTPDPTETRSRILAADHEHRASWHRERTAAEIAAHEADLAACAELDRHDFAMVGQRRGDVVVLTRHEV